MHLTQKGGKVMNAVTGFVELRTDSEKEVEQFVKEHLGDLEDHQISVRRTSSGQLLAEFYCVKES
jgi:hypothetical protein